MLRFVSTILLGCFGALAGSLLATLLAPAVPGVMLVEQITLAQFGAGLVTVPLVGILAVIAARRPADRPLSASVPFALGCWIGLIPGIGVTLARLQGQDPHFGMLALVIGGLGLAATMAWTARRAQAPTPGWLQKGLSAFGLVGGLGSLWLGSIDNHLHAYTLPPIPAALPAISDLPADLESPPDVVLVSIDTLRADAVVGPNAAPVPHLDALRERGTWAEWGRSSSNCTVPGHAGMLFGQGALEHRVTIVYQEVPREPTTLQGIFTENGYSTLAVISNGIMFDGIGFERGFLEYDDAPLRNLPSAGLLTGAAARASWAGKVLPRRYYRLALRTGLLALPRGEALLQPEQAEGGVTTQRALDWLDVLYQQEDPFFFFLHYIDPHAPYRAPEGFRGTISGPDTPPRSKERYLEEVAFSDHCLGQVIERMDASGRPYVILVTSDHGEHLGEHDLWGHTNSPYEELIRVPWILAGPGVPQQEIHEPHVADCAPTLLRLAGLPVPASMSGFDILGGEVPENRLHFARERKALGIQQGNAKWTVYEPLGLPTADEMALVGRGFDLGLDPFEQQALEAGEMPDNWLEQVLQIYADAPPPLVENVTSISVRGDHMAALQEMGYVDPRKEVADAEKARAEDGQ